MTVILSPSDSEFAVRVTGISKCYRIYRHPRDRLLQALWGRDRRGRRKQFFREFWALQELSFSLGLGQTLGVVGRNGSGKSTLLQLLCGTLEPTTGEVQIRGRVAALLELGSGFNPEFSGLENVFLNALLLGLSRGETEERLDEILAFADIGDFINQPVKTYSSGMAVRLAFAVQAHIDPDVLVVDEALAVGDELFQKKCYSHLERLKERGTSVLLVTHSCAQILQHCDQALLLHKGKARMLGEPAKVTVIYQRLINASDAEWDGAFLAPESMPPDAVVSTTTAARPLVPEGSNDSDAWFDPHLTPQSSEIYPSHGGRICDVWIERGPGKRVNVLPFGEDFVVVFSYEADEPLHKVALACHIASHTGQRVSGQSLPEDAGPHPGGQIAEFAAGSRWQVRFSFRGGLWPGLYFIGGGILSYSGQERSFVHRVVDFRVLRVLEDRPVQIIGACSLKASPAVMELAPIVNPAVQRLDPAGS
jgi:lipopolysaccharide transport system ATP-binding protein